jgi:hypothetical protein
MVDAGGTSLRKGGGPSRVARLEDGLANTALGRRPRHPKAQSRTVKRISTGRDRQCERAAGVAFDARRTHRRPASTPTTCGRARSFPPDDLPEFHAKPADEQAAHHKAYVWIGVFDYCCPDIKEQGNQRKTSMPRWSTDRRVATSSISSARNSHGCAAQPGLAGR